MDLDKLITIFYAQVGIPLMLHYTTTIGHIIGKGFKFTYSKFAGLNTRVTRYRDENEKKSQTLGKDAKKHTLGAAQKVNCLHSLAGAKSLQNRCFPRQVCLLHWSIPGDIPLQTIDSGGRHSFQSSSRSKLSTNSSKADNT